VIKNWLRSEYSIYEKDLSDLRIEIP